MRKLLRFEVDPETFDGALDSGPVMLRLLPVELREVIAMDANVSSNQWLPKRPSGTRMTV